jgi:hypothetical protein
VKGECRSRVLSANLSANGFQKGAIQGQHDEPDITISDKGLNKYRGDNHQGADHCAPYPVLLNALLDTPLR